MDAFLDALTARIRAAASSGTPLRIRGGGSKDFYGERLEGELLETAQLSGITSYEPSELVVTVRAGTPLADLEAVLAERGQCLPFEPPHFGGGATVVRDFVAAGLVDHMHLVQVPIVLGRGVRIWDGLEALEEAYDVEAVSSPSGVTHLTFTRKVVS